MVVYILFNYNLCEVYFILKKYIPLFAIVLILFLSCSNNQNQSFLHFSIPANSIRAITNEASGNWILKISITGDTTKEESFTIQKNSFSDVAQTFSIENLNAGQNILVDVSVFCENIQYYKTKETKSLTLVEGANSVDIALVKLSGNSDFTILSDTNISISATTSDGTSYVYTEGSSNIPELPYFLEITFTLSDATFTKYEWYLNGEKLSASEKSISFVPAENDFVNQKTINSLVCFFADGSSTYVAEFKFYITNEN